MSSGLYSGAPLVYAGSGSALSGPQDSDGVVAQQYLSVAATNLLNRESAAAGLVKGTIHQRNDASRAVNEAALTLTLDQTAENRTLTRLIKDVATLEHAGACVTVTLTVATPGTAAATPTPGTATPDHHDHDHHHRPADHRAQHHDHDHHDRPADHRAFDRPGHQGHDPPDDHGAADDHDDDHHCPDDGPDDHCAADDHDDHDADGTARRRLRRPRTPPGSRPSRAASAPWPPPRAPDGLRAPLGPAVLRSRWRR